MRCFHIYLVIASCATTINTEPAIGEIDGLPYSATSTITENSSGAIYTHYLLTVSFNTAQRTLARKYGVIGTWDRYMMNSSISVSNDAPNGYVIYEIVTNSPYAQRNIATKGINYQVRFSIDAVGSNTFQRRPLTRIGEIDGMSYSVIATGGNSTQYILMVSFEEALQILTEKYGSDNSIRNNVVFQQGGTIISAFARPELVFYEVATGQNAQRMLVTNGERNSPGVRW